MTNIILDTILFNYMVPLCNIVESLVVGLIRTQVAVLSAAVIVLTESTSATLEQSFILFIYKVAYAKARNSFTKWLS